MKITSITLLVLFFATMVTIADGENFAKLILGTWLGPRKFRLFHADGTWGVQRNEDEPKDKSGRHWSISGNKLTLKYPGDHGVESGVFTIVTLTPERLVIETTEGYREEFRRPTETNK